MPNHLSVRNAKTPRRGLLPAGLVMLTAAMASAGCAVERHRARAPASATPSFLLSSSGARIVAKDERDITAASQRAASVNAGTLLAAGSTVLTAPAEIPYLALSREGETFLSLDRPRALTRGAPAASCPVVGLSAPGAPDAAEAVADALGRCLAEARAHDPACGCEVVAIDDSVLLPRGETSFAVGITARILSPELRINSTWVAAEGKPDMLILHSLDGERGRVRLGSGGEAALRLDGIEGVFRGIARPVGFRRGRRAMRLYLADARGRRVTLLVGLAPSELAAGAAGWLAFPPDLDDAALARDPARDDS